MAAVNISKWFVMIATATILVFFFLQGGAFLALFIAACFLPLISSELKESEQDFPTLKERAKHHKDFILLIFIFCFWLAGSLIERRFLNL